MKTIDIKIPNLLPLNGREFVVADAFPVKIVTQMYGNGRLAIELLDEEGDSYTTLTTNLVDQDLADGEIFVKTWSENEDAAWGALKSGLFKDTGRRVPTGYIEASVWTIADPLPADPALPLQERETRVQRAMTLNYLAEELACSPFAQALSSLPSPEQAVSVIFGFAEALLSEKERRLKAAKEEP
jgi:hypothetical protein